MGDGGEGAQVGLQVCEQVCGVEFSVICGDVAGIRKQQEKFDDLHLWELEGARVLDLSRGLDEEVLDLGSHGGDQFGVLGS